MPQRYIAAMHKKGGLLMQSSCSRQDFANNYRESAKLQRFLGPEANSVTRVEGVVYLVDDDYRVREALTECLELYGIRVLSFATAREFLDCGRKEEPSCLILDLNLPDISGLDLQGQLAGRACPQIIFISGRADVPTSVRAMKAGAIEFLTKPVDPEELFRSVKLAVARDKVLRKRQADLDLLEKKFLRLTPREREVLPLVVEGLLNKQAASVLGISEITFQIHRSQVMRKMEADSLADLVRMAVKLRISVRQNSN